MYCHDLKIEIPLGVCHEDGCIHRAYCRLYRVGADHIVGDVILVARA